MQRTSYYSGGYLSNIFYINVIRSENVSINVFLTYLNKPAACSRTGRRL